MNDQSHADSATPAEAQTGEVITPEDASDLFDGHEAKGGYSVAQWNGALTRLFRRASRGRIPHGRAYCLSAVANAGIRAATAVSEDETKRAEIAVKQRLVEAVEHAADKRASNHVAGFLV